MTPVNDRPDPDRPPPALEGREARIAIAAAREAGSAALAYYGTAVATMKPGDSPVTEADHAANDVIVGALSEAFPHDAILSEESADSDDRLDVDRVWIVDPLDGTKEFLAQNGEFAVMIGLAERGRPVLGVVYRAATEEMYAAVAGGGAWVDRGDRWQRLTCLPVDPGNIRLVGSRSHPDPLLERVRLGLGIEDVVPTGSVGVKCAKIVEGLRDLYVHPVSYLCEWDTCAPEVLVREAGGLVTDCLGEPLRYNKRDPMQPAGIVAMGRVPDRALIDRIAAIYRAGRNID
jgi:3'(2'), 5'-bisphosphate nucleotidase